MLVRMDQLAESHLFGGICKIAKSDVLALSVHLSEWNNLAPIGWILMKFYIGVFFKNLSRKFKFN